MRKHRFTVLSLALLCSVPLLGQKWVGTWAASPMAGSTSVGDGLLFGAKDLTIRQVVHLSLGGERISVSLTNEFGTSPLLLSDVHIQLHDKGDSIIPGSDHAVKFSGDNAITIPAGQFVTSDPVNLKVANTSDLVVSFCVPKQPIENATLHWAAFATGYVTAGNEATSVSLTSPATVLHWYFLKDVRVDVPKSSVAVVTLGDSITDGARSTPDHNQRWPDDLARRLLTYKKTEHVSVINEGINGNRVLKDDSGPSALARLDRDVLSAPGVKYIILLEGINDIGRTTMPRESDDPVTTGQIIEGYKQIIHRAHEKGIKIIGATLTPYMHAGYYSAEGEQMRQGLNAFIRQPGNFDAVIDFDKVTRNPQQPEQFLPLYNDGDHLHPNDAGYVAMSDAIDLSLFR
jgi:lysophospholipase L1-like esterase